MNGSETTVLSEVSIALRESERKAFLYFYGWRRSPVVCIIIKV